MVLTVTVFFFASFFRFFSFFLEVLSRFFLVGVPFDANGWEQYSLYSNRLTNTEYVTVNRNGTTVVHAMVHNAKIYNSTSSTNKKADSSNTESDRKSVV